jgi:cell pole-organizing protein PopZ
VDRLAATVGEEAMMNRPAPKEPSMDEILSSIRQIIADDDAAPPQRPINVEVADPDRFSADDLQADEPDAGPLALSTEQIVPASQDEGPSEIVDFSAFTAEDDEAEESAPSENKAETIASAEFLDPEDITFAPEPQAEPAQPARPVPEPVAFAPPRPAPRAYAAPPERPRPSPAHAAPMPDPQLSADIAEELLEPATHAAVRANFARLNNLGLGNSGITIEQMMREMLRPMLKDWLDEHLPAVVERMVEKEISRISRGVE